MDKISLVEKFPIGHMPNPTTINGVAMRALAEKINDLIDVLDDIRHKHPRELGCKCWLCHGLFDDELVEAN